MRPDAPIALAGTIQPFVINAALFTAQSPRTLTGLSKMSYGCTLHGELIKQMRFDEGVCVVPGPNFRRAKKRMDKSLIQERLKILRRCVKRIEDKRPASQEVCKTTLKQTSSPSPKNS